MFTPNLRLSPQHEKSPVSLSEDLTIENFHRVVFSGIPIEVDKQIYQNLAKTREFIEHLLTSNLQVYGLTTGFADLRQQSISPEKASYLSLNILESHDAGIGQPMDLSIVKGAMLICAKSLSQGYSGVCPETLQTLTLMLNYGVIPLVPETGSLGASGDLAYLACLGRAMAAKKDCDVICGGQKMSAEKALLDHAIPVFVPNAKEGLALTNGTSFMTSMLTHAYMTQLEVLENAFAIEALFINAIGAIPDAFYEATHALRRHEGQYFVAKKIRDSLLNSPFIQSQEVQNDYCIRCIPQILGSHCENLRAVFSTVSNELNAVTDNPLIFSDPQHLMDIPSSKIIPFDNSFWAVLSGGNFHGQSLATTADVMSMHNAKFALMIERQMTYMLNPNRNKGTLPIYLIEKEEAIGLESGYMIPHYTANALTQKIVFLANPTGIYNITSGNESEDIVSYGATACQKLLSQQSYLQELLSIFLTVCMQAYALKRKAFTPSSAFFAERVYQYINDQVRTKYPTTGDRSFKNQYAESKAALKQGILGEFTTFPLKKFVELNNNKKPGNTSGFSNCFH